MATCQGEPCLFSVCSLLTLLYINYYVSACFWFCQINNYHTILELASLTRLKHDNTCPVRWEAHEKPCDYMITVAAVCCAISRKSLAWYIQRSSEYVSSGSQLSEVSANMYQKIVKNFRRPLRICGKWCTTFGGLCEFVQNDAYIHCPLR